jgi:hypothetical protein
VVATSLTTHISDASMGIFFDVPETVRASISSIRPICRELVRETSETLSEGTNLAGHG